MLCLRDRKERLSAYTWAFVHFSLYVQQFSSYGFEAVLLAKDWGDFVSVAEFTFGSPKVTLPALSEACLAHLCPVGWTFLGPLLHSCYC